MLGAVLQNRLAYNVAAGVDAIPAPVKRIIMDGAAEAAGPMNPPTGTSDQAGTMADRFATLFQSRFTEAVDTAVVVAAVVCLWVPPVPC